MSYTSDYDMIFHPTAMPETPLPLPVMMHNGVQQFRKWFKLEAKPALQPIIEITAEPTPKPKPKLFESSYRYRQKLKDHGFKVIGGGHFSVVMGHPKSDRVIKVCHSPDAWIDYCYWAAMNGWAGNFAPKVYSFKRHKGFYVAVMEKLEHTATYLAAHKPKEVEPLAQMLFQVGVHQDNEHAKLLCELLIPKLGEFAGQLRANFKNGRLDCHSDNVMFRKDNSLVVIDPVCHESDMPAKRLKAKDFEPHKDFALAA
jgi:hypothetical protein